MVDEAPELQEAAREFAKKTLKIRPLANEWASLPERGLAKATVQKYGATVVNTEGSALRSVWPLFDKDGQHVSNKLRYKGKSFSVEGEFQRATLFGQHLFPAGSAKTITITEGYEDACAAYEMQGSKYPCVSVHSASEADKNCTAQFEYLNSFETIVVCFDKDEAKVNPRTAQVSYPGQEAALAVASLFAIGKVRILTLAQGKDANDYLLAGRAKEFIKEWWDAPIYTPAGIKLGVNMWDEISKPRNYETASYPWPGINEATYGIRLSEFVVVTAQTKIGKTSLIKEIAHHLLNSTKHGVGFMLFEETNADTCLGLMSITASKRLHLPDVRASVSLEELRGYFDSTVATERVVIWDHFGSNRIHEILAKIRHMHNLGCKYIILDHLSIVVSDQSGDERKQLDEIATKIKTLCMELNIAVIAVIHQNRNNQIRGTAGVEQLANIVFKLHRDVADTSPWRRNITKVVCEANRFCGTTGPVAYLEYSPKTGRMVELTPAQIIEYEDGAVASKEEVW